MTQLERVGAIDLGGSHVTAAVVSVVRRAVEPGTLHRKVFSPDDGRETLLRAIREVASASFGEVSCWGVAVPGPFDHVRGIGRFRGVHKLDALHGVDLRSELAHALGLADGGAIRFLNDAAAFLLGEQWVGAAREHPDATGVTLGTGLGSAFIRGGRLVDAGLGVPADARLDLVEFRGSPVEDVLSGRGLRSLYRAARVAPRDEPVPDVARIAGRARDGEDAARAAFDEFGRALGEFLTPWLVSQATSCLVLGGSIARAWDIFGASFQAACPPAADLGFCGVARDLDAAPLLGAGWSAALAASC